MHIYILLQLIAVGLSIISISIYSYCIYHKRTKIKCKNNTKYWYRIGKGISIVSTTILITSYILLYKTLDITPYKDMYDIVHTTAILLPVALVELIAQEFLLE